MKRFLVALAVVFGCDHHAITAVRVAAPQSQFPISMSEYIVVGDAIATRDSLEVVGQLKHEVKCAKPDSTADVSEAINQQVRAAGGQGVIAFKASVSATAECQSVLFQGEIIKLRGTQ